MMMCRNNHSNLRVRPIFNTFKMHSKAVRTNKTLDMTHICAIGVVQARALFMQFMRHDPLRRAARMRLSCVLHELKRGSDAPARISSARRCRQSERAAGHETPAESTHRYGKSKVSRSSVGEHRSNASSPPPFPRIFCYEKVGSTVSGVSVCTLPDRR